MAKPKPIGASQIFAEAGQTQKVYQLSSRVEELEAEIVQLKSQPLATPEKRELEAKIQELTQQLSVQGGIQEIEIARMQRNIFQPRQTFPQAELKAFAELLKAEGQHTPVILFPWKEDYLIFDGERRWRSAPLVPWTTLKAVILPLETEEINIQEIQSQALSTSIHRKDLHPLDLAECLINQIIYRFPELEEERDRIPTILNTCLQRFKRNKQLSDLTAITTESRERQREWLELVELKHPAEFNILHTLLSYQLNPASINANVFPLLAISDDLKEVVHEFGLDASKVRELNKLSAKKLRLDEVVAAEIRIEAARKVATENLALSETRELVNHLFRTHSAEQSIGHTPSQRMLKQLQALSVESWQPDEIKALKQALESKLAELEILSKAKD
ncbi:ParB N-terminal domain-containing protein [Microcoleus sp. FACHB-1515]|uniref:ParB/RepB/Spo0J family partition protein n=1 Tax=Cyanophyceae TaxID=3028117 RepID=UPI001F554F86|nr:ParB N-terminal domain-containing protein [Microcoleus sp. FACHB-1515]